jgi:hypothetical protein
MGLAIFGDVFLEQCQWIAVTPLFVPSDPNRLRCAHFNDHVLGLFGTSAVKMNAWLKVREEIVISENLPKGRLPVCSFLDLNNL